MGNKHIIDFINEVEELMNKNDYDITNIFVINGKTIFDFKDNHNTNRIILAYNNLIKIVFDIKNNKLHLSYNRNK